MIPEFTILSGIALLLALIGVAFVYSGFRFLEIGEVIIGGILIGLAWWLVA